MGDGVAARQFDEALDLRSVETWADALLAARVLAIGGRQLGGMWLKARAGGVRETYLDHLRSVLSPDRIWTRLPAHVSLSGLTGGVDIAATAAAGRLVSQTGILAAADGGVLVMPMAERIEPSSAAIIAETMDKGFCNPLAGGAGRTNIHPARFTALVMDESADDEDHVPAALTDRLGLMVDIGAVAYGHATLPDIVGSDPDWAACAQVALGDDIIRLLSAIMQAGGLGSLRVLGHLVKVSRILAALSGQDTVREADAVTALRLCLGIRLLAPNSEPPPPENEASDDKPDERQDQDQPNDGDDQSDADEPNQDELRALDALTELLAAVEAGSVAGIPVLASNERAANSRARTGKAGSQRKNVRRGRPYAVSQTPPFPDARQDVVATLRAAAPWQKIRNRQRDAMEEASHTDGPQRTRPPVLITREDYRFQRLRHPAPSTAIFMVDASGSTALDRLGETKGAIEQLLAKCYVRRDEVALVTFRGTGADITLPPTRSLVMAKRKLAGLPGGGATPLVSGLEKGLELALSVRRKGSTPVLVLLTDGSGNIALDGTPDRALAARQLEQMALTYRGHGLKTICIDIARRPREAVTALAKALDADLHVLNRADGKRMSELVNNSMEAART